MSLEFSPLKDLKDAQYVDSILQKVWKSIARAHHGYILEKGNEVFLAVSNNINIFLNLAMILRNDGNGGVSHLKFIEEFAKMYFHKSTPLCVLFPDYEIPNFKDHVSKLGYAPVDLFLRMKLADCSKTVIPVRPSGVEMVQISRDNYKDWLKLLAISNNLSQDICSIPISEAASPYYGEANSEESWTGFCLLVDGKFVSTATSVALLNENCQYVFSVANHPDYRRNGYASYITWYVVDHVYKKTGISKAFLHSSNVGQSIYRKLGYTENGACVMASKVLNHV
jgi:hypothetical protein